MLYILQLPVCEKAEASKVDVHALLMNMAFDFENKSNPSLPCGNVEMLALPQFYFNLN